MTDQSVTVIIPTTADEAKAQSLVAAIDSVLTGQYKAVRVLVVANGKNQDSVLIDRIGRITGVSVSRFETGSLPLALFEGRKRVETPFFGFLDDDDIYLPNAVAVRLAALLQDPSVDFVATNGYWATDGVPAYECYDAAAVNAHPLEELVNSSWLRSCNALYRTQSIGPEYFHDVAPYMEWTFIGLRLCMAKKVKFLADLTYQINGRPDSLSTSDAYTMAVPSAMQKMLALGPRAEIRRMLKEKLRTSCHDVSAYYLSRSEIGAAWKYHLKSLQGRGLLDYAAYTRHLIRCSVLRKRAG
jgi:hypothetical protein